MANLQSSKNILVLISIIVLFLIVSILSTSVNWIGPSELGLGSKLPLIYWVGFILVGVLWYLGKDSRNILIAAFILTLSYLYFAPTIIRVPPWISNSYYPFGESLLINESGHLVQRSSALLVSYHDWPIFLYFASAITLITGLPHDILLKYFPLFIICLYGLFAFLILRLKLKFSYALFGAAWVLGSLFIRQQYFGPQSISYVFFLLILLLVSWLYFEERPNRRIIMGLLIFLCTLTTFTHPLTSLMALFVIVGVFLTYRLILGKSSTPISILGFFLTALWLVYNMFVASSFFTSAVRNFSDILFGERDLGLYSEPSRVVGSQAMQVNFFASWGIVVMGVVVSLVSVYFAVRTLMKQKSGSKMAFKFFMIFSLVMFALFGFFGEYGPAEAYQRAFMFGLIPISYLCVTLLAKKPKLLVVCLVSLFLLNIVAQYGGDTYRMATETHLAGTKFVADNSGQDVSLVGKLSLYIRYYDPEKNLKINTIGLNFPFTDYNASAVNEAISDAIGEVDYVMSSDIQYNYYMYFLGLDPFEDVNLDDDCNRIYNNDRLTLFKPVN